jgi:hypothetical protein
MNAVIFDSHQYAQRLIDAGVPPQAASVHAEALLEVMNKVAGGTAAGEKMETRLVARTDKAVAELNAKIDLAVAELNTKIDKSVAELNAKIDKAVAGLDAKIDRVAAELRTQIADAKAEMVRMMVGLSVLQVTLVSALVLKLMH